MQAIWTLADLGGLDESSALAGLTDADPRVREAIVEAVEPLAAEFVASGRGGAAAGRRSRRRGPVPVWRCSWATGTTIGRARPWRAGATGWAGLLDARGHPELGDAARAGAPGRAAGRRPGRAAAPRDRRAAARPGRRPARRGLDEAAARSIGRPAGQGGRYRGLAVLRPRRPARGPRTGEEPLSIDLDRPFAGLWESARATGRGRRGRRAERLAAVSLLGHSAARDPAIATGWPACSGPASRSRSSRRPSPASARQRSADRRAPAGRLEGVFAQIRATVLDTLLSRREWSGALLSALEANADPARPRSTRRVGSGSRAAAIRRSARGPRPCSSTRPRRGKAVVDAYRPALRTQGDPAAGAAVFKKLCASCHRLGKDGVEVGPDLATLNDKSPESLLTAILDPNRAVESKYAAFTVATADGRVLNGLIASESATAVTLRRQEGKDDVLLRSEIEEMAASGQSLMPEGLEKDLTPRDLADLIAYIGSHSPTRKSE